MTAEMKEMKDMYENLIFDDVAKIVGKECYEALQNFSREDKRTKLLKIMCEEHNEENVAKFAQIVRKMESTNNRTEHISDIVEMIREYVKVLPTEVKTMGEVMTPISLVEEMLDTLPYEVWTNPNLKWLDPCNGIGTFISVVVKRLMKGLETFQPDTELRYQHIMEKMIYVCELQAKNLFLYMYAFDPKDKYAINIFNGSYLSEDFNRHMKFWDVEKFDVIVMNPPYQELKEGNTKSNAIWDKFVIKTINQLVDGGYLVAVHPDSWRRIDGDFTNVKSLMKSKQMLYLELHDTNDGMKTFGVKTTYDFYCLHNVPNITFTTIKCMDGTKQRVDISKMEFIPNGMYKEFEKLIAKNDEERVNILYSRSAYGNDKSHMNKEQIGEYKYPCVYLTYKDGTIKFWYSNTKEMGHFGIPKVIWSNGGGTTPIIDEKGEYGVMNFAYSIVDDVKNLPFIKKAMQNPDFIKLMSFSDGMTSTNIHRYNKKAISLFRKDFWKEFLY